MSFWSISRLVPVNDVDRLHVDPLAPVRLSIRMYPLIISTQTGSTARPPADVLAADEHGQRQQESQVSDPAWGDAGVDNNRRRRKHENSGHLGRVHIRDDEGRGACEAKGGGTGQFTRLGNRGHQQDRAY
jgi:hypothetical protein